MSEIKMWGIILKDWIPKHVYENFTIKMLQCPGAPIVVYPTGSQDRDCNDIYVGDFIEYVDNPTNVESGIYEVVLKNGFLGFGSIHLSEIEPYWLEIKGNKYEHPNLLEELGYSHEIR